MTLVLLGAVLSVLILLDTVITEYGVAVGLGEANPIALHLLATSTHVPVKLAIALTILLGLLAVQRRAGEYSANPKAQRLILLLRGVGLLAVAVYAFAVTNNILVLTHG